MDMAPNSEEITCGIQKAIVTLCMEAYSSGTEVEIDGIICLRDTKYKQYEVVKIHKTFIKPDLGNATLACFGNHSPGKQTMLTTENNASRNSTMISNGAKIINPFSLNRKEMAGRKYGFCEEKQEQFSQHSKVVSEEVILDSPVSHNGYMYSSKDGDPDKQAYDIEKPITSEPDVSEGQSMYLDHKTMKTTTLPVVAAESEWKREQVDKRTTTIIKDDQRVSSELFMEISMEQKEKEVEDQKKERERQERIRTVNETLEDDGDCVIVKIETEDDTNHSNEVLSLREIPISAQNLAFHMTSFDYQKRPCMIGKKLSHSRKRSLSNTCIFDLDTVKSAGLGSDLSENEAGNQSKNSLAHDDSIHEGFHGNVFNSSHDNSLVSSIEIYDYTSGGVNSTTPPLTKFQKITSPTISYSETTRCSCSLCGMQFVTKSNLFRHMRSSCKLVGRKAPCHVCGKMLLDRPDNMKEHMLSQHGVE